MGLFSKKKSSNAQAENPYAQEPANDPYAYQSPAPQQTQNRPVGLPSGPRAGRPGVGLPSGPGPRANANSYQDSSAPPPPYQTQPSPHQPQQSSGYSSDRYGAQAGYGSNRYGDNGYPNEKSRGSAPYGGSQRGPGGYGGLGGVDNGSNDDAGREALFGGGMGRAENNPGRDDRNASRPNNGMGRADSSRDTANGRNALFGGGQERYDAAQNNQDSGAGGYGSAPQDYNKYGGYGEERELTEEEKMKLEERDLARQIDEERNATVDTGYRILDTLNNTIETANGTMQNLAQQDERLRNTERNLDLAAIHNRTAEGHTKDLKYYNRSLFMPGFKSKGKVERQQAEMLAQHQRDRIQAEATQRDAYESRRRYENDMNDIQQNMANRTALGMSGSDAAASNNKFVFDESEDEDDNPENQALRSDRRAKEAEINNVILPGMQAGVRTLKGMAEAFAPRIEESNQLINRIGTKSDAVDDGVRMNRAKLDAFSKR